MYCWKLLSSLIIGIEYTVEWRLIHSSVWLFLAISTLLGGSIAKELQNYRCCELRSTCWKYIAGALYKTVITMAHTLILHYNLRACLQEAADDNSVYRNEVHHSLHQGRALHQVSTQRSCLLPGPITIADQMAEEAMVSIIFHNSLLMVFEFPSNKDTLIASETRRFFICKHR